MNERQKVRFVRNTIKAVLYAVAIVSVYLILRAVLSGDTITITVNWVKAYIGTILFLLSVKLYNWLFPLRRFVRKDDTDVSRH